MTQEQLVRAIKLVCIPEDMWSNSALIQYWLDRPDTAKLINSRVERLPRAEQEKLKRAIFGEDR